LPRKQWKNRNWSFGINVEDSSHQILDPYLVSALNVNVGNGFVESRPGLTLFNEDMTKSGGITMMVPSYFRDGKKQLVFANDDDYYFLNNTATTSTAWGAVGDYGTAVTNPFGFFYKNYTIFGTGLAANAQKKWDGTTLTNVTTQADASSDLRFYEYHQGANVAYGLGGGNPRDNSTNNNSILYYTVDPDAWNGGGLIAIGQNDGQSLRAIKSHGNILAYKDNSAYKLDVVYESNSGTNIMRVLERFEDIGAVNHEVVQVALNDVLSLSQRHGVRGFQQVQTQLGGSQSRRLSTKIKPLLNLINWSVAQTTARAVVWDMKYYVAVPMNGATTNNAVFVGHLDLVTDFGEIPWTLWDMNIGSMCPFQDENGVERLMIGDSNQPKIYFLDPNALSDDQNNISTKVLTKRIDMGDLEMDEHGDVIISGLISELTDLKVKVVVDGIEATYIIRKEQIINPLSPIWSHVIGSEIVGSTSAGNTKPRFLAVLSLPDALRVGNEIQFEFSTSGQGMYWRLESLSINENINSNLFPDSSFVSAEY